MSEMSALALLWNCYQNRNIDLQLISGSTVINVMVCGVGFCTPGSSSIYTVDANNLPVAGELCYPSSPTGILSVNIIPAMTPMAYALVPDIIVMI